MRSARAVATWLDDAIAIPGTRLRIGLDPLVGLVPGIGDLAGALASAYLVLVALQLGAPAPVAVRMVVNLALDAVVGAIPLAGDLFDFAWKANRRNLQLLEAWVAEPRGTAAASRALVVALLALTLLATAGLAYGAWRLVVWAAGSRG